MKELSLYLKKYLKGADLLLLFLCTAAASFGCVLISSATRNMKGGVSAYLPTQILTIVLGIGVYLLITAVSLDWLAKFWKWIAGFNICFNLLLIPFGVDGGTGNKSWLYLPGIPFSIQAPEVTKVTFILLLAAQMYFFRERVNGVLPVASFFAHTLAMMALIFVLSSDLGVALIYAAILIVMMIGAGVKTPWFLAAAAAAAAAVPVVWSSGMLTERQKNRILIVLNPQMDPDDVGWHSILSMETLSRGGLTGQGLYQGRQTGLGNFPGQHTDFIFTVAGEELGLIGCLAVVLLLCLIILRVLFTARKARSGFGSLVCFGVAGMILFQTFENTFMCAGVTPIIGITLPFFSCGGSSNIVMFAAVGLVSSVRLHKRTTWLDY